MFNHPTLNPKIEMIFDEDTIVFTGDEVELLNCKYLCNFFELNDINDCKKFLDVLRRKNVYNGDSIIIPQGKLKWPAHAREFVEIDDYLRKYMFKIVGVQYESEYDVDKYDNCMSDVFVMLYMKLYMTKFYFKVRSRIKKGL